ncbi:MAG: HD domain-containing protein [Saprospiraceae bacterium]|nr:HD domain-containing protein [Saprospiraceae bacterium]
MAINPIVDEILQLFQAFGHMEYGEGFSVNSHSIQAGLLAKAQGLDEEMILAAFLHDIGHLYPLTLEKEHEKMGEYGIEAHDRWGKAFLEERGFSARMQATVKNHVAAKRYLCAVDAAYHDQLSLASQKTLTYQGGPMSEQEVKDFELDPYFRDSIMIRKLDDEAKENTFEILPEHWQYFQALLSARVSQLN